MGKMLGPKINPIRNPLKGVAKGSLKKQHTETLAKTGLRSPKSPL